MRPITSIRAFAVLSLVCFTLSLATTGAHAQPVAQGSDFRVGSSGASYRALGRTRAVSLHDDGSFVVVWLGNALGLGIHAQRYDASGSPEGTEFLVSQAGGRFPERPAVTHTKDGEFVVVWTGAPSAAPSSGTRVLGRRLDPDGVALGDEFEISSGSVNAYQAEADLTAMDDGSFVVVWPGQTAPQQYEYSIFAQRMNSEATKVGTQFIVNTQTGTAYTPQVGTRGDGSFVVAWAIRGSDGSPAPDGAYGGVFGQRFASNASKLGTEFQVNTFTNYSEHQPDIAVHSDGSFVIVWTTQYGDDEPGSGGVFDDSITMRRYNASGNPLGDEEHINTYVTGIQREPAIMMDDNGSFVVVWRSASGYNSYDNREEDGAGLFGRCFNAAGVGASGEFHANSDTAGFERTPSIATDGNGEFVVVWERADDGYTTDSDAFARRFSIQSCSGSGGTTTTTTTLPGGSATLTVTKTDNDHAWGNDATIAYDITVTSENGSSTGVVLTETVPEMTTFVSGESTPGWVCTPNGAAGSTCTYDVGALGNGQNEMATFAVEVDEGVPPSWDVFNEVTAASAQASVVAGETPHSHAGTPTWQELSSFCDETSIPTCLSACAACFIFDNALACSAISFFGQGNVTAARPNAAAIGTTVVSADSMFVLYEARDRIFNTSRGGERATDLYYQHSPAIVSAVVADSALRDNAAMALNAWVDGVHALISGEPSIITQGQADAFNGFVDALAAVATGDLAAAVTRESSRLDIDDYVGQDIAGLFDALDLLTCEGFEDTLFCGEVTGDCVITATDALRVLRIAVGSEESRPEADLDGSGSETATDALITLRIAVGLEPNRTECNPA